MFRSHRFNYKNYRYFRPKSEPKNINSHTIFSPFIHRFLYYYYIRFWPFGGVKIHNFCQNIQFIVVINKRTHYISHSSLLPYIYLFFIKFMTYFDKYHLTFSVKNGKKAATWGCLFCIVI